MTKAATLEPTAAKHIYNRGVAYYHQGQMDRAIADFSQALKLDPKNVYALAARGVIFLSRGDFTTGRNDFERANSPSRPPTIGCFG